MKIQRIISRRNSPGRYYMDIVYEWEDIIAKHFNCKIRNDVWIKSKPKPFGHFSDLVTRIQLGYANSIKYDIDTNASNRCNYSNIIPIIIDFYESKESLTSFFERYSNHPLVFISSKEVYDYLIRSKCPLRIAHLPLSLPDKYMISQESNYQKKYDLVLMGRTNPVFLSYLERYQKKYPNFSYIYPAKWERARPWKIFEQCYYSSKGERIGICDTRQKYFQLMQSSKVALYSTPSKDLPNNSKNGWNQVTPRFLEYLACGCHVLCRYDSNPDTHFYELERYWPSIDTYNDFEQKMNEALNNDVDVLFYSHYLKSHTTTATLSIIEEKIKGL